MLPKNLSVIIPTLNEEGNIKELIKRFSDVFEKNNIFGELIFIDDHSNDKTKEIIIDIKKKYNDNNLNLNIRLFVKKGRPGKAQSLIEGFGYAKNEIVAMIDADLQYPPEAIIEMLQRISENADIVVANRKETEISFLRKIVSKSFNYIFARFLHSLNCDVQSGLKMFKKEILSKVKLDPSPWTFDMEFLLSARNFGYKINSIEIFFYERTSGKSKVKVLKASFEIGWNALKLKIKGFSPLIIKPSSKKTMRGAGVIYKGIKFITHSTLPPESSALKTFSSRQIVILSFLLGVFLGGMFIVPLKTGIIILAILSLLYFIDVIFNLVLVLRSLNNPPEIQSSFTELKSINEKELPVYTVLCPLYKEAHMLKGFVNAIKKIHWPKEKLEVLLLLEENDQETINTAREMNLPSFVEIIVVPHSMPKTKPKACNYGLSFAKGEYVVIYDAEDIPDPWQLKKAYLGFKKSKDNILCLQAKLNYFNPDQNLLTKLFTAEYSLWFDVILTGLQSVNTSIPLGGTSNHFRTKDLLKLQGWDPFNVTEDCDLGIRLFMWGYRTAIIDSVTLEEANSNYKNWLRQRSRWIKGYMQTYLVHMRNPVKFFKENKWHALAFQFVVGGKIAFMLINPVLWITTILYFTLNFLVGDIIHALYPTVVFYMASISLVFGNFLYVYYYMIGCAKRKQFSLIKYIFLVPFYWIMVSVAASIAAYQLFAKPHYWEKTNHGLHLANQTSGKIFDKLRLPLEKVAYYAGFVKLLKFEFSNTTLKKITSFAFSSHGFLMIALVFNNLINFGFNVYLSRNLSLGQLAVVVFVSTIWYLATILIGGFASTINHTASYIIAKNGLGQAKLFLKKTLSKSVLAVLIFSLFWVAASPFLSSFFHLQSYTILILISPIFLFGMMANVFEAFLRGDMRFSTSAVIILTETVSKFVAAFLLVSSGKGELSYLAIPLSLIISCFIGYLYVKAIPYKQQTEHETPVFPFKFLFSSVLTNIYSVVFLSLDVLVVKHYFSNEIAGQYSILSFAGKIIYFLGILPLAFMFPYVSKRMGEGKNTETVFYSLFAAVSILVSTGLIGMYLFGIFIAPFIFGNNAIAIVGWLPLYSLAIGIFTLANTVVYYNLAKHHYLFSYFSIGSSLFLFLSLVLHHQSINEIVNVYFAISLLNFFVIGIMHFLRKKHLIQINRAFSDFLGIFDKKLPQLKARTQTGKRILIFNWRDIHHKFAGGAEIYVHEISKSWVSQGHQITLFCGNDGQQKKFENIDGINIVRRGGFYLVYVWAFLYYIFRFRGKYDIVIDCENGVPFFTPLYVKEPIYALMHHVHQDVFFFSLLKPFAMLASFLEKDVMPFIYRNIKFITVSQSSKLEMLQLGIGQAGIDVVNPGINPKEFENIISKKTEHPSVLFLGRLKAYKSVNILIKAFKVVLEKCPQAKLIIAGSGDEEENLKKLSEELKINQYVQFLGKVTDMKKISLLQSSWMLVNTSMMEGWGIVVIEANACGTPVIASDVPGLRDSVSNGKGGYLLPYGNVEIFAEKIIEIINDHKQREILSTDAKNWAENFSWEKSGLDFLSIINENVINESMIKESSINE